eukprot:TRINITY_DN5427_c0_g2_i1.p1 TRINITY_DN5427_c0_g2~~TRINITY_DN5427_c0_g2_i1.p1  ORF type:complete len:693 (+),score=151.57 TRINITY_DN5427_c0_g2_i1:33-2111(+)
MSSGKKPLNVQSAKVKLNELFVYWLTLPEAQELVQKLDKAGGHTVGGSEILLDVDSSHAGSSPVIALDRAALGESLLGHGGFGFTSPPRSPRASPSQSSIRHSATLASPLVDELDAAHRQGAMSPHGSPRATRLASPENASMVPTSPLRGPKLSLGSPAQSLSAESAFAASLNSSTSSLHSDSGSQSTTRLSAAFAQMQHDNQNLPPLNLPPGSGKTTPSVSPSLTPLDQPKKKLTGEPRVQIPKFYFPKGKPPPQDENEKEQQLIKKLFESKKPNSKVNPRPTRRVDKQANKYDKLINSKGFQEITKKVCQLPKWMSELLFRRVVCYEPGAANYNKEKEKALAVHPTNTTVGYQKFMEFYEHEMAGKSKERRLFDAMKWDKTRDVIIKSDLRPLVEEVLLVHPGLEFLKTTPDFQERYADTVQIRILYSCTMSENSTISWLDFRTSSLYSVLHVLDEESDINVSHKTEYFSYEHFYVLYCKFWELDTDHDFYISKEDLAKYGVYSLTNNIIDRVFSGKGRALKSDVPGLMNYEDFVWFCLCEEDKTTSRSLDYWFRCTDLDGDGVLSGYEIDYFFQEQKQRMESSYQETISYDDILCQMMDMIAPAKKDGLRRRDIKSCRLSGNFFNALFNLTKFIAFEQRDPFMAHAEKQLPEKTDWDRFAKVEYDRMSHEAGEQEDVSEEFAVGGYNGG